MNGTEVHDNLKMLQDLKFLIYKFSDYRVDFHNFDILTLDLPTKQIDLSLAYQTQKKDHTIEEIAWSIIKDNHL
ncbi:hypothetical protein ACVQ8P_07105 [Dellaglioa sp. BT-FLS60]